MRTLKTNMLLLARPPGTITHRNPRSNFLDYPLLACFLGVVAGVLLPALLNATEEPVPGSTFVDVNPDMSSLDTSGDPDGASGGRCNGLASVPGTNQIFYAASEWGGLYRTSDAGLTWSHLDGHVPQATWDVEVDPSNANKIYATSFYDGRLNAVTGIQVSSDGGASWVHPPTTHPQVGFGCANGNDLTQPSAFGIGIRPDAPNNVFVGTSCGIAITNDAGATWELRDPNTANGVNNAARVWDVVVQGGGPMGQGIVDICGDEGHFRSTDGGVTWTTGVGLPSGRSSIAVSPDESYVLFVAAADNNIYESDDGGANWTFIGTPDRCAQGRIPFVKVNDRTGSAFDLWYGDVRLWRAGCTTPNPPAPGGALRCPLAYASQSCPPPGPPTGWAGPFTRSVGGHDDVGDIIFDPTVAVDACPMLFTSDGGVYRNTDLGADCQNPDWEQPNRTPHGLWNFGMTGVNQPGDANEDFYFGCQDNGSFGTTALGNTNPTWNNADCCDVFDFAADANRALYPVGFFTTPPNFRLKLAGRGLVGGGTLTPANSPPGSLFTFQFPEAVANFGDRQYVVVTSSGVFITTDITANPVVWTQLGAATDPGGCALQVSMSGTTPTFYLQVGCNPDSGGNQIWRFIGTNPSDSWVRIDSNDGQTGGVNIFAADPADPNRLYACNTAPGGPRMVFSTDAGVTWNRNLQLDSLMTGGGIFRYQNQRGPTDFTGFNGYFEPSLLAFDPENPGLVVAGGRDSGVFLSYDGGGNWVLLTDPFTPGISGIPHLPRPRFAYFDHEPGDGKVRIYVATQGRGVWRIIPPPAADLSITKTGSPDPVITGNDLTYTVTVTNNGPDPATSVTVMDDLPAETTFVSCSSTGGGVCAGSGNNRTVTFASLTSGESETITFVATVDCSVVDGIAISNTASVSSSTVDPNATNNAATATITASNPPPTITGATADPSVLWPPNHRMVNVAVSYDVTDNCPLPPGSCTLSVTSNEPVLGHGSGHTTPDWIVVDDHHVLLRAERQGNGHGRIYTITITCVDSGGNSSSNSVTVTVPHDRGRR